MGRVAVLTLVALACSPDSRAPARHAVVTTDAAAGAATDADVAAASPLPPGIRLPGAVTPLAYAVQLEVDPDREAFRGSVAIRVQVQEATDHVWLHAVGLEFQRATFASPAGSGALTKLAATGAPGMVAFGFPARVSTGEVTLTFEYTGHAGVGDEEGLFRQQSGGRWFLYAQSEALFARRILPCFDEPRWKPAWQVTLTVPADHVALGNGAVMRETKLGDGRRRFELAEIAAMPSYLFAIAVGPFAVVEAGRVGRGKVPVRIAVGRGDIKKLDVITARLPAIVDALETYLDRPLPLAKLEIVAVPRFFGAMENLGLVTIDAPILLADARSPGAQHKLVRFIAHELAHQWFGNSATPGWWDDLWLAEAFSTWLGEKITDEVTGGEDALRAQLSRLNALAADDAHDPRAIRRATTANGDVDAHFDAISYEKGSTVLAAVERFVGSDAFREVIRRYLREHASTIVTTDDFLRTLAASSPPARAALEWYVNQPGSPVVEIAVRCEPARTAIEIHARDGAVPVCVRHAGGKSPTCRVVAGTETIALDACPAWVIGNAGGAGYYRIANPLRASAAPLTPVERLAYADDLGAAIVRGDVPAADGLRELRALAAGDILSQYAAIHAIAMIDPIVDDAARPAWSRWIAARFAARLAKPALFGARPPLEREVRDRVVAMVDAEQHAAATVAAARVLVDAALVAREHPPDLALAIAAPRAGKPLFDKLLAVAATAPDDDRSDLLEALGAFGPELAPRVVDLLFDTRFKAPQVRPAIAALLERPATRTATWQALRERAPRLAATLAKVDIAPIVEATATLCDRTAAAEVTRVFADHLAAKRAAASIEHCAARRARIADDLTAALRR